MMATKIQKSMRLFLLLLAMSAMTLACSDGGADGNNNGGNNNGGNNNGGGGTRGGRADLCGNACPKGQYCWNGVCVVGCNTNDECASDQYCDTDSRLCANKKVPTCPETACAATQECVNNFCSAKKADPPKKKDQTGACKIDGRGNDGCGKMEVCVEKENGFTQCRAFPPCNVDGSCPSGLAGSVCNQGLIPEKGRICLVGACQKTANCPGGWSCVKFGGVDLGLCSSGSTGTPCNEDSQCKNGVKCMKQGGEIGICFGGDIPFP